MELRLGLVGHNRTIKIVKDVMSQHFRDIQTIDIEMDSEEAENTINFIKKHEASLDGLLFTGKIPYDIVNNEIFSQKPWVFIKRDASQLLTVLLESVVGRGWDIFNVSIDSYTEEEVMHIYEEIRHKEHLVKTYVAKVNVFSKELLTELKLFHENNYYNKKVSFCITGISSIYQHLLSKNIPCLILDPTIDSIKETLNLFSLKRQSIINENSQIVVISVERDLPNEYALINENEYQLSLETMKITEAVYLFAQKIQAAVVDEGNGKYILFTTKNLLALETNNLQKLDLLNINSKDKFSTVSIGIGYGETAREAKYNASLGLLRAKKEGGNKAFWVINNQYNGQIVSSGTVENDEIKPIDGHFQYIADQAGVSLNSIFKLQRIIDQEKRSSFTANDLAKLYGISSRSMNRLVEKLIASGHAVLVGKNVRSNAGRPSRIIRLEF